MMTSEQAKKIIEELFVLLGITVESVDYTQDEHRGHIFSIKSTEFAHYEIENATLNRDLVYLLKRIFNKTSPVGEDAFKCSIDINNQQSKVDAEIRMRALNAAEEARSLKADVLMPQMSSYERMVTHSTLAEATDITTESFGEGRDRRIKIKYLPS